MAFWTEEQKAFVIYYRSLGTPGRTITSLLNSKFRLSRKEDSITNVISRINKKDGEESRLLAVANRYPWKTVTNDERNALNKTAHGSVLYNDEQRSYVLYFFARGIPTKDIVTNFNQQFSTNVSFRNLDSLIWRTRSKNTEKEELLKAAEEYLWFTDQIPENHRPLTPTQHLKKDTTDDSTVPPHEKTFALSPAARKPAAKKSPATKSAATNSAATKPAATKSAATKSAATNSAPTNSAATNPAATNPATTNPAPTNPQWTMEEKAFAIYHTDRGMKAGDLLDCLNAQFRTTRKKNALVYVLSFTRRIRSRVAHLRQYAQQFEWYTPDAAPGAPPSNRTGKAPRTRKARKRVSEKTAMHTPVPNDDLFRTPSPTPSTTNDSALPAPLSPLTIAYEPASPSVTYVPPPAPMTDYGALRLQFSLPAPLPLTSSFSRGCDVLQEWGRLSPRFASPERSTSPESQGTLRGRQAPLGDRRSRSPLTAGPFWFGDGEEEEVGMRG